VFVELSPARLAFERRLERTFYQAVRARAVVVQMPDVAATAIAQLASFRGDTLELELPMARLAQQLALTPEQVELVWTVVACSVDGRLVSHLESLSGGHARRGLSLQVYGMLSELADDTVARLAHWLASPNSLVRDGLLDITEPASPAARAYVASPRLVGFLTGDDQLAPPLQRVTAPADPLYDERQRAALPALKRRLASHIVFATPTTTSARGFGSRQITTGAAPIASDVDHEELGRTFPMMSGANIRNAAISAAFLAATEGAPRITREHLIRAARAEYRSMGHVVPEVVTPRTRRSQLS
jgi:hypothetical protein